MGRYVTALVACVLAAGSASAAALTNSTSIEGGIALPLFGGLSVVRNASGVWDFGDLNGDGTRDDAVTPPGLDLKTYKLYTTNVAVRLDLNGGSISNGYYGGVAFSTGGFSVLTPGDLDLQNVCDVSTTGALMTSAGRSGGSFVKAGKVSIGSIAAPARNIALASIDAGTYPGASRANGNDIELIATGSVRVARFFTHDHSGAKGGTGAANVKVGTDSVRAAEVEIGTLLLSMRCNGTGADGRPGSAAIYAVGNVSITNMDLRWGTNETTAAAYATAGWGTCAVYSATGKISFDTLDMSNAVVYANATAGKTFITNAVRNFAGSTVYNLRCPPGQVIHYNAMLAANAYLNSQAYALRDLDGVANGGKLSPLISRGTLVCFF
jgi:hypothetical protein